MKSLLLFAQTAILMLLLSTSCANADGASPASPISDELKKFEHTIMNTRAKDILESKKRVVVIGDMHGDLHQTMVNLRGSGLIKHWPNYYNELLSLLPQDADDALERAKKKLGINMNMLFNKRGYLMSGTTPDEYHWSGGKAHVVFVGDAMNVGPDDIGILRLVKRLQREAHQAGGHVEFILGNHEVANLKGDFNGVHPWSLEITGGPEGRKYLLSAKTAFGRWLRSCKTFYLHEKAMYVHGGFSTKTHETIKKILGDKYNEKTWMDEVNAAVKHVLMYEGEIEKTIDRAADEAKLNLKDSSPAQLLGAAHELKPSSSKDDENKKEEKKSEDSTASKKKKEETVDEANARRAREKKEADEKKDREKDHKKKSHPTPPPTPPPTPKPTLSPAEKEAKLTAKISKEMKAEAEKMIAAQKKENTKDNAAAMAANKNEIEDNFKKYVEPNLYGGKSTSSSSEEKTKKNHHSNSGNHKGAAVPFSAENFKSEAEDVVKKFQQTDMKKEVENSFKKYVEPVLNQQQDGDKKKSYSSKKKKGATLPFLGAALEDQADETSARVPTPPPLPKPNEVIKQLADIVLNNDYKANGEVNPILIHPLTRCEDIVKTLEGPLKGIATVQIVGHTPHKLADGYVYCDGKLIAVDFGNSKWKTGTEALVASVELIYNYTQQFSFKQIKNEILQLASDKLERVLAVVDKAEQSAPSHEYKNAKTLGGDTISSLMVSKASNFENKDDEQDVVDTLKKYRAVVIFLAVLAAIMGFMLVRQFFNEYQGVPTKDTNGGGTEEMKGTSSSSSTTGYGATSSTKQK